MTRFLIKKNLKIFSNFNIIYYRNYIFVFNLKVRFPTVMKKIMVCPVNTIRYIILLFKSLIGSKKHNIKTSYDTFQLKINFQLIINNKNKNKTKNNRLSHM